MPPGPVILFRADATPAIGTGHIMRCLAIAEALVERGAQPAFACAEITPALTARLDQAGWPPHPIPAPPGSPDDLAATRELGRRLGAAATVLDGYRFDADWRRGLAAVLRPVLTLDDEGGCAPLSADLVVNPSPAAFAMGYDRLAPGARLLLGPDYVLLRRDIRAALALPRLSVAARTRILLTFGGSDPAGLTVPVLKRLAPELPEGVAVDVVVGGSNPRRACVDAAVARFPDRAVLHLDTPRMGELMAAAGLAVSAAGGTTGELAALAVPTVLVTVAGNQTANAADPAMAAWTVGLDGLADGAADRIAAAALALWREPGRRAAMADAIAGQVDGLGALRVADALLETVAAYRAPSRKAANAAATSATTPSQSP